MRKCTFCLLTVTLVVIALPQLVVADEDFSVVINPRTGAATLRNDTDSAINLDGYLFVADPSSPNDVFSTGPAWDRISDGNAGWFAGQATTMILSEVNLTGALNVPGKGSISLGTPYQVQAPSKIGEAEPEFDFTYSVDGTGVFSGDVEFEADNNVVLVVDPTTGAAILENQSIFDVDLDSYLIQSGNGVLDPSQGAWGPLASSLGSGWSASSDSETRIREINILGSTPLSANGGSLPIGSPINLALLEDESDLAFKFSYASGGGSSDPDGEVGGVVFRSLTQGLPGDFSGNGAVENADLTLLLNNWAQPAAPVPAGWIGTPQPTAPAIDNDELTALLNNWGITLGAGSGTGSVSTTTAIPEPASWLISLVTACALGVLRRRG